MIFFTSDHHFGHENIIECTGRPFDTAEAMDKALIHEWNEVVGPSDIVYHLGDFTLGSFGVAHLYFSKLNGFINILGMPWHHDKRWLAGWRKISGVDSFQPQVISTATGFVTIEPPLVVLEFPELGDGTYPLAITLCHYPLAEWDRKHFGAWHLHGHSHGNHKAEGAILDVGVDCRDFVGFAPVNLEMVKALMVEKIGT